MSSLNGILSVLHSLARAWRRHPASLTLCAGASVCFAGFELELLGGQLDAMDLRIQQWVRCARGSVDGVMFALTWAGGFWPMTLFTVAILVGWLLRGQLRAAGFLLSAAGGNLLLNMLMKAAVHRPRPSASWTYLIEVPTSYSFPSGHTMGTAGVVASLLVLLWIESIPRSVKVAGTFVGLLFIVGVGASRVYFGVHYPSDVLGAWLLATAWVSGVSGWMGPMLLEKSQ